MRPGERGGNVKLGKEGEIAELRGECEAWKGEELREKCEGCLERRVMG